MNYVALMLGALGLVSIVTIFYVFLRKPAVTGATPTAQPEKPAEQQ
jgi:hypothetical protein